MPNSKRKWLILLNILAIVTLLCFIFGNSLMSRQESVNQSSAVSSAIRPLLYPIVDLLTVQSVTDALLHTVVRKLAHFAEFAGLAVFSTLLLLQLRHTWRSHCLAYVLFGTLLTAVLDEFLQSFTGRGSSVRDVMIDFGGALFGIVLTFSLHALIRAVRRGSTSK